MVVNKDKKNVRQRGNRWHGWGRGAGHHKGAGNRGGRGRAGSGKRGDAKKPLYQKAGKGYLGKDGFTSHSRNVLSAVTIATLVQKADKMGSKKGEVYTFDLSELGYDKLLGTGKVSIKMNVTVDYASAGAIEKIEAAGGKITVNLGGDEFEDAPAEEEATEDAEKEE